MAGGVLIGKDEEAVVVDIGEQLLEGSGQLASAYDALWVHNDAYLEVIMCANLV